MCIRDRHEAQHAHRRYAPRREDGRAAGAVRRLVARQREHATAQDERDDGGDEPEDAEPSLLSLIHICPDGRFAALMQGRRKPVVVGYSMGGRVALAAVSRQPGAFARCAGGLVLESAGLGPVDERERKDAAERDARNAAALRRDGLSAFMDAWERLPLFATQRDLPASTCERVRAGRLANDAEALARAFEQAGQHAMPSRGDVLAALASLRDCGVPVRYIAGARDAKYRALAEDLEDEGLCEVRVVAGAGHNVHLEEPAAYLRALGVGFPG